MSRRTCTQAARRSRRHRLVVGLAAPVIALVAGFTALAYWASTGTGSAGASVGTLEAASISAPGPSAGTITIGWDVPAAMTPASQSSAVTYTVERRLGAGAYAAVPSGACAGSLPYSTVSCDDVVSVSGTYAYRVVAHFSTAWTALSNEVTVVATLDSAAPTTTIGFPADSATLNGIAYGSGCTPTGLCGTASDATGVDTVRVSVQRHGAGYWTGSSFGGFSEFFLDAALLAPGAAGTAWNLPLPLPADGQYTIHVQAKDTVGNDSAPTLTSWATFRIDTSGPTTSLTTSPAVPDGTNGWYRRSTVDFSLSATDPAPGSGVASTSFSIDAAPTQAYSGPVTISTQGDHVVSYRSVDNAGNPGPAATTHIALDNVAPSSSLALSPAGPNGANGWYRTAPTFTLTAGDTTSGVATTSYRIDGGPVTAYVGGAVTVPEGQHTVSYWSVDNAGNTETAHTTATVKVDTTAPSTSVATTPASPDGSNGWFRLATVSFALTGSDTTSGVASRHYTIDGGAAQTYSAPVTISSPGDHVVTYWTVDVAGNVGPVGTTHVKLDAVAPTTTAATTPVSPDGSNNWFKRSSVVVTLAAADGTSGVASTTYTLDGGSPQLYTGPVTIAGQGDHTLTFQSTDTAGNVESVHTVHVKLDDVAPATSLATTPAAPDGSNGWFRSSVSFTLTATDATSGVATRHYRLDGGATQTYASAVSLTPGDHTVEYWSLDNAGNAGSHLTTHVKLDTTAPVTTLTMTPGAPDGANGWFKRASISFTLAATDLPSGAASTQYTIDGGAPQTYSGGAVTVATQGDHTVTFWSTDNAGNVEAAKSTHVKLDNVSPTVAVSLTAAGAAHASGTTVFFKQNASDGTRTLRLRATVGDTTSQPASASYPGLNTSGWTHASEAVVTTPGSGVYDSAAFTWSTSAGSVGYAFTVVDQAGNTTSQSLTFTNDTTAPVGTISLGTAPVGALLTGTTLYYRSNAAGSFSLIDTVTDSGAGPASATFPSIATSGWTHNLETVTSGTGSHPTIAYQSGQYAWTASPGAPSSAARTITSTDRVGNTGTTTVTFTVDNTGPTGGALRVNGIDATGAGSTSTSTSGSFTIGTRTDYNADAGSGFATSVLTRRAAALSGATCGAFGAPTTIAGSPAQAGLAQGCYLYTLSGTDNLGNTSSLATTVKVDPAPVVTLTAVEDAGGFRERFVGTTTEVSGTITIQVSRQGNIVQTYTFSPSASPWSYETAIFDLFVGLTYTARARQTDAGGNVSEWSDTITFVAH